MVFYAFNKGAKGRGSIDHRESEREREREREGERESERAREREREVKLIPVDLSGMPSFFL